MKIKDFKLGPTGQFPEGKISTDDEGELKIALVPDQKHRIVRMLFGTQVSWLALPASVARELAGGLLKFADEVDPPPAPDHDRREPKPS